jgi:glutathione synthase/RimK-type ligase-like ATP-grasp enzyme
MAAEVLDPQVEEACIRLARRLDLLFAGIDLKITPDGEVYCFEVNPSPGFNFYELGTGQPISLALADLLHAAPVDWNGAESQLQRAVI